MAQVLLILAHPLEDSFCAAIAARAEAALEARGDGVDVLDLYREDFDPRLSRSERRCHYSDQPDHSAVADQIRRLRAADKIVLVFPQWWFAMPAILKGYFDRVFQPGVAFDHTPGYGQIRPRLKTLQAVLAVSTLGSARWVSALYMGYPVKRQLRRAIVKTCAPQARFRMLNCYDTEKIDAARSARFLARVEKAAAAL
ncbi:NAD(P)H-dependent oxidoreductase [Pelagibius sp.]|uniref:NAD(P)H-dependent oxidoreductase n=1 Tax=Pelagibius sp. TaxID=1931238 RepID=UPI003B50DF64